MERRDGASSRAPPDGRGAAMNGLVPTLLLILDGWGIAPPGPYNAPSVARTPHMDALLAARPHSLLAASGREVGLPAGYIGNSEVGHMNIGAGRVVYQDMTRIDVAMENGELDDNPVYRHCIDAARAAGGRLHLAGLLSDGGVHSHIGHLIALARIASAQGVETLVHCFMDGRDASPYGGIEYVGALQKAFAAMPVPRPRIASLCGRFYAMDRDKRWERVKEAWDLLVHGAGQPAADAENAIRQSYAAGVTDEFIKPVRVGADSTLRDGDGLFFFNFRADRMRQLVQALTLKDFNGFERGRVPAPTALASMTSYDAAFTLPVAFPKEPLRMGLGETISRWGARQLRLAETEKYAHVTYFFNGGVEEPFPGEERIMTPSPRHVPTYDLAPAMSCREVTGAFLEAWRSERYALVVCNLANGDMVGHTGVMDASVAACEAVDECVGRMVEAVRAKGGRMLIIADHGNCESMRDQNGRPHTAHTTNPVPCILVQDGSCSRLLDGKLADVAPTLLALWQAEIPSTMTGRNLAEFC